MSLRLKSGDTVKIIAGELKGQTGKIHKVFPQKKTALIEGKNIVKRHTKPNKKNQQGGILEKEAPVHLSNMMLLCEKTDKPTRFGIKVLEDGKKTRYTKRSKEQVD